MSGRPIAAVFVLLSAAPVAAQREARARTLAIGPHYAAGAVHQWLLGKHYRDLWVAPLPIEVLDLGRFAGGLTPLRVGGGRQTRSLRFAGADGKQYVFRSVDKNPTPTLPPVLQQTAAADVMQDQISSAHPAGPLVVAPLLEAVGVLHAEPRLVVMPDDERLNEFRAEFAGMIGMIEERPEETEDETAAFAGASRFEGSNDMLEIIEEEPGERADVRAYLAARIMDVFLGDWDRHVDQWRWARIGDEEGNPRWAPIPRDRDQAFARLDGVLPWLARRTIPQFVHFGPEYPAMVKLTWQGRVLDRRLLPALERPVWDSVTTYLTSRLTDDVIEDAVARMPAAFMPLDSARLASALRRRRDALPVAVERYYRLLSDEVDVHTTDEGESVRVERVDGRFLDVGVTREDGSTVFRRRFDSRETSEIRLYLHGGADQAVVNGTADNPITVRIVGGGGRDTLVDSTGTGGVRFYDAAGTSTVLGPGSHLDSRNHDAPQSGGSGEAVRDFGSLYQWFPWLTFGADVGLLAGVRLTHTRYGFGKAPFARRISGRVGYAMGASSYRAELAGEWRREHADQAWLLSARASGLELLHFYGYGNETSGGRREDFEVQQKQYRLNAGYAWDFSTGIRLETGAALAYTETSQDTSTHVGTTRPYGTDDFGELGLRLAIVSDKRDAAAAAASGYRIRLEATGYPGMWDVATGYGTAEGEASVYLTPGPPTRPTLALRAGGRKIWGRAPLHDAAFLGGAATMRGFSEQRFAGDAAVFGNAELRIPVARFTAALPGEIGVLALADGGRVWWEDEDSDRWHGAAGGGLWFAFLDRAGTVALTLASGTERTTFNLQAGFAY